MHSKHKSKHIFKVFAMLLFTISCCSAAAYVGFSNQNSNAAKVSTASSDTKAGDYHSDDGVVWIYSYDIDSNSLSVAFESNPNRATKVTIPSITDIQTVCSDIPDDASYTFESFEQLSNGKTNSNANINASSIIEIDAQNVKNISSLQDILKRDSFDDFVKITISENTQFGVSACANSKIDIDLSNVINVETSAFDSCEFNNAEQTIKIPRIAPSAFYNTNLTKVYLSDTQDISTKAFANDTKLELFTFNNTLTHIGSSAFLNCSKLSSDVSMATNLQRIDNNAFENCTNLNIALTFDNSQLSIGNSAFKNSGINTVSLKVSYVDGEAFTKCNNLTEVTLNEVNRIEWRAFADCPKLSTAKLYIVRSLASETFADNRLLKDVVFGTMYEVPYRSFYNDTSLTNVSLSDSIKKVATEAFANCSIKDLDLNKVNELQYRSFADNKLEKIYLPKYLSSLKESNVFQGNAIKEATVAYNQLQPNIYNINFRTMIGEDVTKTLKTLNVEPYDTGSNSEKHKSSYNVYKINKDIKNELCEYEFSIPSSFYQRFCWDDNDSDEVNLNKVYNSLSHDLPEDETKTDKLKFTIENARNPVVIDNEYIEAKIKKNDDITNVYTVGGNGDKYTLSGAYNDTYRQNILYLGNGPGDNIIDAPQSIAFGWFESQYSFNELYYQYYAYEDMMWYWKYNLISYETIKGSGAFVDNSMKYHLILKNVKPEDTFDAYISEDLSESKTYMEGKLISHTDGQYRLSIDTSGLEQLTGPYTLDFTTLGIDTSKYNFYDEDGNKLELTNGKCKVDEIKGYYIELTSAKEANTVYDKIQKQSGFLTVNGYSTSDVIQTSVPYAQASNYYDKYSMDLAWGKAYSYKNIIAPNYFYGLANTENVNIGEGYEFIGAQAFYGTASSWSSFGSGTSYKNIKLPSTLKGIGSQAFMYQLKKDDDEYTNINLPDSLEYIGYQAFFYDSGINEYIDLPNLTAIGDNAFAYSNVSGIYAHDKMSYFGSQCVFECPLLKDFIVDCDIYSLPNYYGTSRNPSSDNFFGHVDNHNKFDNIIFTDKVVTEPGSSFDSYNSTSMFYTVKAKNFDLSKCKWKRLGRSCFQQAEIDNLKLPEGLEQLGEVSLYKAKIKEEIQLPQTLKRIESSAIQEATLTTSQLPNGLQFIGPSAFYCTDFNHNIIIPETVTYIGNCAFGTDNSSYYNYVVKFDSVTFDCDFNNTKLANNNISSLFTNSIVKSMHLTNKAKEFPSYINLNAYAPEFYGMKYLETVKLDGIQHITRSSFQDCPVLKTLDLSEDTNLMAIGSSAFYNDKSLDNIKIANTDNTIELYSDCFRNTGIKTIGKEDSDFDLINHKFISGNSDDDRLTYTKNADSCSQFAECKKLTYAYIPNGFNNNIITDSMLYNNPELSKVDVDYRIKTIKQSAFNDDKKLTKLFIWGNPEIEKAKESTLDTTDKTVRIINTTTYDDVKLNIVSNNSIIKSLTNADFTDNVYEYKATSNDTVVPTEDLKYSFDIKEIKEYSKDEHEDLPVIVITIRDFDTAAYTIPLTTDIYSYSNADKVDTYVDDYKELRQNEKINTNSKVYPLDEVLAITSNNPEITIEAGDKDFDHSQIKVYGLRRDGIILESDTWTEFTKHYTRKDQNMTFDTKEDIYDTIIPVDEVYVGSENFESMVDNYDSSDITPGPRTIKLTYTDKTTKNKVSTNITANIIRTPISISATYTGDDVYVGDEVNPDDVKVYLHFAVGEPEETKDFDIKDKVIKHIESNDIDSNHKDINNLDVEYTTKDDNTLTCTVEVPGIHKPEVNPPIISIQDKTVSIEPGEIKYDELDKIYYLITSSEKPNETYITYEKPFDLSVGTWTVKAYETSKKGFTSEITEKTFTIDKKPTGLRIVSTIKDVYAGDDLDYSKVDVFVQYDDGSEEEVYDYTPDYDPKDLTLGERKVNVIWKNLDGDFTVNVIKKPRLVTIKGVLKYTDGTPISNKQLTLKNKDNVTKAQTDNKGQYEFSEVVVGDYKLEISEINSDTILASCDISIDDKAKDDKINVNDKGDYDISTKIDENIFNIDGLLTKPVNKYTVKFVDWDNTVLKEQVVEENTSATAPSNPSRTGYDFTGWDQDVTKVTKDMTVKATYDKHVYKITFVDWDNKVLKEENVKYLDDATAPADPTRTGYDFTGWDQDLTKISKDMTVKATYDKHTYTVKFVDWDGKVLKVAHVKYLDNAKAPKDPTRKGYDFTGWNKDLTKVSKDMTVKATYDKHTYKVKFVDWDGKVLKVVHVKYLNDAKAPKDPTRENYTFSKWDKKLTKIDKDMTVKAVYDKNPQEPDLSVKTGDEMPIGIMLSVFISSLALLVLLKRKNK